MYQPRQDLLSTILGGITRPSDNFGFKILEAGASNTLIITTKDGNHPVFGIPIAIKVWINRSPNQLIQEKAVEYEKKVYERVIKPIFNEHKEPPFLKYLGSDDGSLNIQGLGAFIGADNNECLTLLRLAFCVLNIFSQYPLSRKTFLDTNRVVGIDLMSKKFYQNFFQENQ